MVQGSWVGDPLPAFFLLFSVLLFVPCEHISCLEWGWVFHPLSQSLSLSSLFFLPYELIKVGGFTPCASILFLSFPLLVSLSSALMRAVWNRFSYNE